MKEIRLSEYSYLYSPDREPVARVSSGERFAAYTEDASTGRYRSIEDLPEYSKFEGRNPCVGPIFVEGAEKGDTLKVDIISIEYTRDYAYSRQSAKFGGLQATSQTAMLNEPLEERYYRYDRRGNTFIYNDKIYFEGDPFIGSIATAPGRESLSTMRPFENGGNMDVPAVRPGNTLYLPVSVKGAYLYVGDLHARQGDGEICGSALEMAGKVTLECEVIKKERGMNTAWPRLESETSIMAVGCARPLEDAARIAGCELISWLTELGWEKYDAYQLISQGMELKIGNIVDPLYTVVAGLPKEYAYRMKK